MPLKHLHLLCQRAQGEAGAGCARVMSVCQSVPGCGCQGGVACTHLSLCACWEYIANLTPAWTLPLLTPTSGHIPYQTPCPSLQTKAVFINTVQAPLQQDQDFRLWPECFPSSPVPTHDFCRDLWWFPLQELVSHAEEALAEGSSLEEDMGWEVAVHTLPGATGM